MNDAAIQVTNLNKIYGAGPTACQALHDVTISVAPGEFAFLVGQSGSGKTTLLSIIGCVLRPTSGTVKLLGEDISVATEASLPRLRLAYIGFIFQGHNLLPPLTALLNVSVVLQLRGYTSKKAQEEAARLLALVGLGDKLESLPNNLSIGQCQRVAIARALAGNPPIILADEPTASLDAENGQRVVELLKNLARTGRHSVIVVTHDNRIFPFADRVIFIEDGRIQEGKHAF